MRYRLYEELFGETHHFSRGTRTRLEKSVGRALFGRKCDPSLLRSAVYRATRELRARGLDAAATLNVLAAMVENGGRACRADRASLLSGQPLWMAVRARVIESAEEELALAGA
jgi:hypothetical protein